MSDETEGLIERAAALSRRSSQPQGNQRDDRPRSSEKDNRADHARHQVGHVHPGPPPQFDAHIESIPAPTILEQEEWRLEHLFRAVSLHKIVFIATTFLCFVASAAVIFSLTRHYTASAVVAIGTRAPSIATRIEADVDGNVTQFSPDDAAVNTQVDYLRSRPVAQLVMDKLHLWKLPEFDRDTQPRGALMDVIKTLMDAVETWMGPATVLVREWRAWLSGSQAGAEPAPGEARKRDEAVDIFMSKLAVDAGPKSQIITVKFEDPDPKLAAAAANAVADEYIARQIEMASGAAQRATEGLEKAVAALRTRVAQSAEAYENYRGAFEPVNGRELLREQAAEAAKELSAAEVARQVIVARLAALQGLSGENPIDGATSEVTESRVMQNLHGQAAALQAQLAELSTSFGDANPQIRRLEASIARVHAEMRAEVRRQTAALRADLKVANAKEATLRQKLAAARAESTRSSSGQARLEALKVKSDSNRDVLHAFLTRLHEANTSAELLQRANAEIVAPASVPSVPTFPKTKLLLVVAAVGSTLVGFGAAVARERAVPTFRSSEEIEVETGIRTLALIPLIDNPQAPPEVALASAGSFYGEAIRALYATLLLRQRMRMFVVTSARPGEGKTALAASLALVAAKAGREVLLVDADLCTAGASRIFRLENNEGVAELIDGSKVFDEVVATAVADPNLHFLAAGSPGKVLAARSGVDRLVGLLRQLRDKYDLIVINSPPVLAVADAMTLAAQADAALFAVRWGSTRRSAVKLGLRRLHVLPQGASVGAVLTMVDAREHSRFGYADSAFYTKDLVGYYKSANSRG